MTYQPVVPYGGMAGWAFLQRTQGAQQDAFEQSPVIQRDTDYFLENIGRIDTAEQLVSDRRLLNVALGAFGLDEDIDNSYFIRKVLEDGTLDSDDLANKLTDKRYLDLAQAFGFGDYGIPRTKLSDFGAEIVNAYTERQFEIAVGNQSTEMRLMMGLERDLGAVMDKGASDAGKWYSIMGNTALRSVFETAFSLPGSFGALDVDDQLVRFQDKAEAYFGERSVDQFSNPEKMEELSRLYLAKSQISNGSITLSGGSIALTLLQNAFG
ncbi:DUF1217 domain-containing protein [Aliiroseovarius sp.]|uniref:DUF1217 domain-containing protein n=1 Tax=Aliiroseovarius sp. TaxID=1872442 RepID=UPI00260EBA2E|nr:DUF1217 domain-containing protein [Aliiroseovarius sp.]